MTQPLPPMGNNRIGMECWNKDVHISDEDAILRIDNVINLARENPHDK